MGTRSQRRIAPTPLARAWAALLALLLTVVPCTADFAEIHAHDGLGVHLHLVSSDAAGGHVEFHARAHTHEDGAHHAPPQGGDVRDEAEQCDGLFVDLPGDRSGRSARATLGSGGGQLARALALVPLARLEGLDPPALEPWRPPPRAPDWGAAGVRELVRIGRSLRL